MHAEPARAHKPAPSFTPAAVRGESLAQRHRVAPVMQRPSHEQHADASPRIAMRMPTMPVVNLQVKPASERTSTPSRPATPFLSTKVTNTAVAKTSSPIAHADKSATAVGLASGPSADKTSAGSVPPFLTARNTAAASEKPISGATAASVPGAAIKPADGHPINAKSAETEKASSSTSEKAGAPHTAAAKSTAGSERKSAPADAAAPKIGATQSSATGGAPVEAGAGQTPEDAAAPKAKALGPSGVAEYLTSKGAPKVEEGIGKLRTLKHNEKTHDDAPKKLTQAEHAVAVPFSEGQSKSNAGQVSAIGARPAPKVDPNIAKRKLQQSLTDNVPHTLEQLDSFKEENKARTIGSDVMGVVHDDKSAVTSTFEDIGQTPAPAPPDQSAEALPAEEAAPTTAALDLGNGVVAPLKPEHTDLSSYTNEADSKLTEEGISQEQLDMVDSGDLAEAKKEKKGLESSAKTESAAVQDFAKQETGRVDAELKKEESTGRDGLKAKRKDTLSGTSQKQKDAKSALEKKRDEVATKINGIYKTAQDNVKKKLVDLDTQSMKRFEDGNASATKAFEDNIKRDFDAFKKERYRYDYLYVLKAADWLLGIDDLPQVKEIFSRNRTTFVDTINQLVDEISESNKRVIQECKDELENAKKSIKDYVDTLGPDLKDIGKKTASEMNDKLDELDKFVNQKEAELQAKLKDKQEASIKAIDDKIEKMKDAMSGALSKLGKLLLAAAKKFFSWALSTMGYSLKEIEDFLNKGATVLKAIFTQPIQFVKNLINAALLGFKNFEKNFLTHLKDALFEWLTGSIQGLILPQTWNFQGIISVALQMIGISYQNIRAHLVEEMGETAVAGLEKGFQLVVTLVKDGPMAAWEQLKEMAAEMRDAFIQAIKDFIKTKIIEQAITWLIGIFVPGAGIVKAIIGIYDTIVFFIQKAKQIMQMISSFLGAIGDIAAGSIGAAADALEGGLARGLSLVITFLAKLLHLDGITEKIRNAIASIRAKVDGVLRKVAKWIVSKAKALWGKAKDTAAGAVEWWKKRKEFKTKSGEKHEIFFQGDEKNAVPMVASDNPMPISKKLQVFAGMATAAGATPEMKSGKALIDKVTTSMKTNPNYATLLTDMEILFDIYGRTGNKKVTMKRRTGSFAGDRVGLEMEIDWMGKDYPLGTETSQHSGVQDSLMGRLVTEPVKGLSSSDKYIRGHLLNAQLGGLGIDENLFPITGKANSQHLVNTETEVKNWHKEDNVWIWYHVTVEPGTSKLDPLPDGPPLISSTATAAEREDIRNTVLVSNFIDSVVKTEAKKKDDSGKELKSIKATIPSQYKARDDAHRFATKESHENWSDTGKLKERQVKSSDGTTTIEHYDKDGKFLKREVK